jgi:alpha-D-ribose 1-methylphosphonate 5-triphosphate synthase subunit PhnH
VISDIDLPGFDDPVLGAQGCFRVLLNAMAVPGRVEPISAHLSAPPPLTPATAAVLLTLVDADAPLHLDLAAESARGWIAFHCGAPFTSVAGARFALELSCPDLMELNVGTDEGPEQSCTLILQVRALGVGAGYRLTGPGLREPMELRVDGLPDDFTERWAANHVLYPRGIDVVLCADTTLAALPRSVRVEKV